MQVPVYNPEQFIRMSCPATGASGLHLGADASDLHIPVGVRLPYVSIRGHDGVVKDFFWESNDYVNGELVSMGYASSDRKIVITIYND